MAQETIQDFYWTNEWKHCRKAYTKSKRGLCEECLKKGIINPGVIVHHKIHVSPESLRDPDVLFSFDNLELLCREHHAEKHKRLKRWKIDETGKVIAR
jgi:5-methylcytosine-specific restriction endonuclease McrA